METSDDEGQTRDGTCTHDNKATERGERGHQATDQIERGLSHKGQKASTKQGRCASPLEGWNQVKRGYSRDFAPPTKAHGRYLLSVVGRYLIVPGSELKRKKG